MVFFWERAAYSIDIVCSICTIYFCNLSYFIFWFQEVSPGTKCIGFLVIDNIAKKVLSIQSHKVNTFNSSYFNINIDVSQMQQNRVQTQTGLCNVNP